MFRGVLLLKNKTKKRSQKQNKRKSKKRKQQTETNNFKLLHQLISADLNSDVNVEALASLSVRQVRWLTKMARNGHLTERAIATAQDYLEGLWKKVRKNWIQIKVSLGKIVTA